MEFGILGPVEVRDDGRELTLGGPKQRALLAILLLAGGSVVSRDRLTDGLWGERAPASADHTLDDYISRLRKALGDRERIVRRAPGYALIAAGDEVDLVRFETALAQGREQLARDSPDAAATTLRAALALWRGPALADLVDEPFAADEARRLDERRLVAREELFEAELRAGRPEAVLDELEAHVHNEPLRERPAGQLMRALYAAGRQAEALDTYRALQRRLAEDLGLEPGPQLKELERRILIQDPELAPPPTRRERSRTRLSRAALLLVTVGLVSLAAALALALHRSRASTTTSRPSLLMLGKAPIDLLDAPAATTRLGGALWLAEPDTGEVVQINLASRRVVERISVGGSTGAIASAGGSIWTATVLGSALTRIDPGTDEVTQRIPLGEARIDAVASGDGKLWLADPVDAAVLELDPRSGTIERTLAVGLRPTALLFADDELWVADYDTGLVSEVDPTSRRAVLELPVGTGPTALCASAGSIWVANRLDSTVTRIDPARGIAAAAIPVGSTPVSLACETRTVLVANADGESVSRIDATDDAVHSTPVDGAPTVVASVRGHAWVGLRPIRAHRGGTLVLLHSRPITTDPALQLDLQPPQSLGLVHDGLVSYDHVAGPAGLQLVPDLAVAVPSAGANGTTYTFRLRPGIRYSNGVLVRAGDFRWALERVFRLRSPGASLFGALVGAHACLARPPTCNLARGVITNDRARTVTFELTAPDPNFLTNLTVGSLASPVPNSTPLHLGEFAAVPGTGPYKTVVANRHEIVYARNPYFREWSHAAQPAGNPDRIVMRFGLDATNEARAVEAGNADWLAEQVPGSLLPELEERKPAQLHSYPLTETDFLQLNTSLPPFDDVRVRRAFNLALDRRVVVADYGGANGASPACQVLPPGVPGYRPYCPYTGGRQDGLWHAPDLAAARRLVAVSQTRGERIVVWGASDDATIAPSVIHYAAHVLRSLGYRASARFAPSAILGESNRKRSEQLVAASWEDISAGNFFQPWFLCSSPYVHGWFCNTKIDHEITTAGSLERRGPAEADSAWSKVDRDLTDLAEWVPLANPRQIDFVSGRVRNFVHSPAWDVLVDQLWITSKAKR